MTTGSVAPATGVITDDAAPAIRAEALRWLPAAPVLLEEIDISEHLLLDIALRHVYLQGTCTIQLLSGLMKLSLELTESLFRRMIDQQYVEVRRMAGDDYVFALSPTGRRMSTERSATLRYAGPVPVSLAAYTAAVRAQAAHVRIDRATLRRAFRDIVIGDVLLDALGPALVSQRSIFLYGPSGTGKTTISERLTRVYEDGIRDRVM